MGLTPGMQRLILVRHAEAQPRAGGQRDIERPLSPLGLREAAALGRALAAAGLRPDMALVSSAARTRQTWDAAQAALSDVELRIEPKLYNAEPGAIDALLKAASGRTVLLVAHNPGIALYAAHLAQRAGADGVVAAIRAGFPPATAVAFSVGDGEPVFEQLFRPAEFGAGA